MTFGDTTCSWGRYITLPLDKVDWSNPSDKGRLDLVDWNGGMDWNGNKLDTSDCLYRPPLNKDHLNLIAKYLSSMVNYPQEKTMSL